MGTECTPRGVTTLKCNLSDLLKSLTNKIQVNPRVSNYNNSGSRTLLFFFDERGYKRFCREKSQLNSPVYVSLLIVIIWYFSSIKIHHSRFSNNLVYWIVINLNEFTQTTKQWSTPRRLCFIAWHLHHVRRNYVWMRDLPWPSARMHSVNFKGAEHS